MSPIFAAFCDCVRISSSLDRLSTHNVHRLWCCQRKRPQARNDEVCFSSAPQLLRSLCVLLPLVVLHVLLPSFLLLYPVVKRRGEDKTKPTSRATRHQSRKTPRGNHVAGVPKSRSTPVPPCFSSPGESCGGENGALILGFPSVVVWLLSMSSHCHRSVLQMHS